MNHYKTTGLFNNTCYIPRLELRACSVHVAYDVTYVTNDSGEHKHADQKREPREHELLESIEYFICLLSILTQILCIPKAYSLNCLLDIFSSLYIFSCKPKWKNVVLYVSYLMRTFYYRYTLGIYM